MIILGECVVIGVVSFIVIAAAYALGNWFVRSVYDSENDYPAG